MVRTRLQARLHRRYGTGENTTDSSDSEVSFNPTWLDKAFLTRTPRQDDSSDQVSTGRHDMGDYRQEHRMQLLESAVMGMTERFDELLSVVNSEQTSTAGPRDSNPPQPRSRGPTSPARGAHAGGRHYTESRPPRLDHRAPHHAGFVAEQLQREEFHIPRIDEGKSLASDMFIKDILPKPYMYLDRPGLSTLKKKLEVRDTMTFHEYLIATIKMIRDPRAEQQDSNEHLLEHLQQVVQDAASRDWPSVRRWSQATFDAVELGTLDWADRYAVQIERMRHAILAARAPSQPKNNGGEKRDIPCKDYNAYSGCSYPRSHSGRTVMFIHVCSACFTLGDRHTHASHACPRRPQAYQQLPAIARQAAPVAPPPSKNGMAASQYGQRTVRPILGDFST